MTTSPEGVTTCRCGCGLTTKVAARSCRARGNVRGRHFEYIHGHNRRTYTLDSYTVNPSTGCWEWQGWIDDKGYPWWSQADGSEPRPYRRMYVIYHGLIPEGTEIDHTCHNKLCINPDHLEAVTHTVNIQRRSSITKLTPDIVREIRRHGVEHKYELAQRYGVAVETIRRVLVGIAWRNIT